MAEENEDLNLEDAGYVLALTSSNDVNIFACRKLKIDIGERVPHCTQAIGKCNARPVHDDMFEMSVMNIRNDIEKKYPDLGRID